MPAEITPDAFNGAFALLPSAVCVITTGPSYAPMGATINPLMPLSLKPPLLTFALKLEGVLHKHLPPDQLISVHLLAKDQSDIARRFAGPSAKRFQGQDWQHDGRAPRLGGGVAVWVSARVRNRISLGDHMLIIGTVLQTSPYDKSPLINWQRSFTNLNEISQKEEHA